MSPYRPVRRRGFAPRGRRARRDEEGDRDRVENDGVGIGAGRQPADDEGDETGQRRTGERSQRRQPDHVVKRHWLLNGAHFET